MYGAEHLSKDIYTELAPYADMVVDQGRGVTIQDLTFASMEDYWSTGAIAASSGELTSNSTVELFTKNIGESGQGFTAALTSSETNNKNGNRQPSNEVYIGLAAGFQVYYTSGVGSLDPEFFIQPEDIGKIGLATSWTLTVGNSIERRLGTVLEYPAGSGPYADLAGYGGATPNAAVGAAVNGAPWCGKRKLAIPVVFPPNIQVALKLEVGSGSGALAALSGTEAICFRMTFRGFRMTLPS